MTCHLLQNIFFRKFARLFRETSHFRDIQIFCFRVTMLPLQYVIRTIAVSGDLNLLFSGDWNISFSGDWNISLSENYNTSIFGRLKCAIFGRLKCAIFGRLKCTIFGRLKCAILGRLKCVIFGRLKWVIFRVIYFSIIILLTLSSMTPLRFFVRNFFICKSYNLEFSWILFLCFETFFG